MAPKEKQQIEIEKTHRDPLLSFNQEVTVDCSDFLGTALVSHLIEYLNLIAASVAHVYETIVANRHTVGYVHGRVVLTSCGLRRLQHPLTLELPIAIKHGHTV